MLTKDAFLITTHRLIQADLATLRLGGWRAAWDEAKRLYDETETARAAEGER